MVQQASSGHILVGGYANFPQKPGRDMPQFVPVNIILHLDSGVVTDAHTPIYPPMIDAALRRIFLDNSLYVGMDFYVNQIRASMHLPSIELLVEALYDLYVNLLHALNNYWTAIRLPIVSPASVRLPETHHDYFFGATYLGRRLKGEFSDQLSVFAKVDAACGCIEDCWFSKSAAFSGDNLRALLCGYNLRDDPRVIFDRIGTYCQVTGSEALVNMFADLIKSCHEYYGKNPEDRIDPVASSNRKGERTNGLYAA